MIITPLRKTLLLNTPRRDRHELVQDQELELQLQDVAESLYGVADARLVEIDQDDGQDVQADGDDVDVDEVGHDAALADARFEIQELGQGPDVDAADDAFGDGVAELSASIDYGFSGRVEGGEACVVGIVCLPDERPGRDDHKRGNDYDHDEHPSLDPAVLIDEVEPGIENQ